MSDVRGYLFPERKGEKATPTINRIEVVDPVGLYRVEPDHDVKAETGDQVIDLGIRDASVSRKRPTGAPVVVAPGPSGIEIRNVDNTNEVTVYEDDRKTASLSSGNGTTVRRDCEFAIGFNTRIHLSVGSRTMSREELDELGGEWNGVQYEGAEPTVVINSTADNVRLSSRESPSKCLQYAKTLHGFMVEYPAEDHAYEEIRDELDEWITQIDSMLDHVDELGESRRDRIERLVHRIEQLYARSEPKT